MATERTIQCIHYLHEGSCDLGKKKCRFWKEMQTCPTYKKKPARCRLERTIVVKKSKEQDEKKNCFLIKFII